MMFAAAACGQEPQMSTEHYEPRSTLVAPQHEVTKARYPFIEVHSHQWGMADWSSGRLDTLVMNMDSLNLAVLINLSGRSGEELVGAAEKVHSTYPGRILFFANISFDGIDEPDWARRTVAQLERDVDNGAVGLKIYKSLGLSVVDSNGERVAVDDPRIDPVWQKCGDLGIPVLIHTAEPAPLFEPQDRFNERWLELKQRPERHRPPERYPSWEQMIAEQHNVFRRHPETTFINAHLGWLGNDLGRLGQLFDELPNVYTETGAVLAELGRQPRSAREFLIKYKDRVMFGKDAWAPDEYHVYFRAFETADEYFDYYRKRHAHWKIYGLDLPDEVLRHIYYKNALQLIPGIDASLFPQE
jgi:predicted TIM-barrel fold metal-dependent hydrolase